MHLLVSLVKVAKLLTLESSFILAFDQLGLEEGVFMEPFAFPQGLRVSQLCLLVHYRLLGDAFLPNIYLKFFSPGEIIFSNIL